MISRKGQKSFLRSPVIDQDLEEKISYCENLIEEKIQPAYVKRRVQKVDFFGSSKTLTDLMDQASQLIFIGITLGQEAERLIQRLSVKDKYLAYVMDGALSAYLEDSLDRIQKEDQRKTENYITDRFSPGYGDIDHALQRDFARVLDIYKNLGLSLSKENLLIPRKSVLAVYGETKTRPSYRNGCGFCNREVCQEEGKARCSVYDR